MPWSMQDYPASMKNLEKLTRKKAIAIGNALLADHYPEERALPIAISQAKKWMADATEQERHDFAQEKNPTKTDKHEANPENARLLDATVMVKYQDNEWFVISEGAKRASERFDTKEEAIERGKEIADNKESHLKVYKMDGSLQKEQSFE